MTEQTPLPDFARGKVNLASPRLGSEVIFASDEFFAPKERLLQDAPAVFIEDKYDDNGKWMDGWESRRRRDGGNDHCIIRLGVKGLIDGFDIDTSHFTGNFPPGASIEGCLSDSDPDGKTQWREIVPATTLGASSHHFVPVENGGPYNYLRLTMLPDGGIARLRVYGEPVCEWKNRDQGVVHELSALANGGRIIACNNAHFGDPWSILTAGRGLNMGDGWETRRRREPGNDWIIVALGHTGIIEKIEVDTAHFKGNYPDRCSIEAALVENGTNQSLVTQSMFWQPLLAEQKLQMDKQHFFDGKAILMGEPVNMVRLNIHPDGGVSRLRVFGKLA
jgi:allantoicase